MGRRRFLLTSLAGALAAPLAAAAQPAGKIARIGYLTATPGAAAKALGVGLHVVEARSQEDFDPAFSDMIRARAGAVVVLATAVFAVDASGWWIWL